MATNKTCIMKMAPMYSTIRINTNNITVEEAKRRLIDLLKTQYQTRGCNVEHIDVDVHPKLNDLLVVKSSGPNFVEPVDNEIYVDEACASAVMRGADIFACGVLASNKKFSVGDKVSVYADLSGNCLRGAMNTLCSETKQFLGNGITRKSRQELFTVHQKELKGIGVSMTEPIYICPRFDDTEIDSWGFAQNLPSVLCGHVLDPQPGDIVLDLCAAPGGKSTHLAALMKDKGKVVCIDVSANRLNLISKRANIQGLNSIELHRADGTNLISSVTKNEQQTKPPFPVEFFDKILVDAPCSCLGGRPFLRRLNQTQVASYPKIQRKLLKTACQLLKKDGILVYSTCTLTEAENEENVEYVLKTFPDMALVMQEPFIMSESSQMRFVQKFDPRLYCELHTSSECLNDTTALNSCIQPWNPYCLPANLSCDFDTIEKCIQLIGLYLKNRLKTLFTVLCDKIVAEIADSLMNNLCQALVALPNNVANILKGDLPSNLKANNYSRSLSLAFIAGLDRCHDLLQRNTDCSLKFHSQLIGKLQVGGYSRGVLEVLIPYLNNKCNIDFVWSRIAQRFLVGAPRNALEQLLTEIVQLKN